jgi:type III secretion system low calcium response chaperone LcrH/SycD
MKDFNLEEFKLSKRAQKKLKNRALLKKELSEGKSAQEILGFSDETMGKFYQAAYHLFDHEYYQQAADAFLFLVTLNPKNHDFWLGFGMSLQMCGQFEEAIDAYELAAYYKLESPVPYFYLAKCMFAVHDRENALKALDLAVEYSDNQIEFLELKKQAIKAREMLKSSK